MSQVKPATKPQAQVIATVGSQTITKADAENYMRRMDPRMAQQYQSAEGARRLTEDLIHRELLYLEAVENGLDQDQAFLAEVEKVKTDMLKQYATSKLITQIQIDDQEVEAYYKANEDHFINPVTIKASHILLDDGEKAQSIYEDIQSGTLTFENSAEKDTTCEGVDLGYFTRGKMVPAFEEVAFQLEVDEVGAPVKTDFGYHIIKVYERKNEKGKTFAEVRDELKQQLLAEKQQKTFLDKVKSLRDQYPVELNAK